MNYPAPTPIVHFSPDERVMAHRLLVEAREHLASANEVRRKTPYICLAIKEAALRVAGVSGSPPEMVVYRMGVQYPEMSVYWKLRRLIVARMNVGNEGPSFEVFSEWAVEHNLIDADAQGSAARHLILQRHRSEWLEALIKEFS